MITYLFYALVGLCTLLAFTNWRLGVGLWMLIAILQDPVRKITPGTPVYMTVSFLPVYLAAFASLVSSQNVVKSLARDARSLSGLFFILVIVLSASSVYGFAFSHKSVMASLIGIGSYAGGIPAIYCGYAFLKKDYRNLDRLLLAFVIVTAVMLIGVPLEHHGVKFSRPWLGTIAMTGPNRRWFNNFDYVSMISGFHRSPEIMGWHAMAMVICTFYMYLRRPSLAVLWSLIATWGCYGVFHSGRRKMLLMLFMFAGVFLVFSTLRHRRRIVKSLVLMSFILVPGILFFVDDLYRMSFSTGIETAGSKAAEKMWTGPIWLAGVVGPFGYGVGTLTQGTQHFVANLNIPLVEGGMEKVMVEIGLLGLFLLLMIAGQMLLLCYRSLKLGQKVMSTEVGPAFCFAYVAANLSAFMIAFQFLGDPFIGTMLGLFVGMLLSTKRMAQAAVAIPPRLKPVSESSDLLKLGDLRPRPLAQ